MIEKLAVDQKEMCKAIGRSQRAEQYAERCERLLEEARKSNSETRQKIRILEQQIERSREDVTDSVARTQDNFTELERLTRILFDAKQCIQDALMVQFFNHILLQNLLKFFENFVCFTVTEWNWKSRRLRGLLYVLLGR